MKASQDDRDHQPVDAGSFFSVLWSQVPRSGGQPDSTYREGETIFSSPSCQGCAFHQKVSSVSSSSVL